MPIITLTTDFGTKDFFVAAVKGAILSKIEKAKIIDISHKIRPHNIYEGAHILKNAAQYFPKKTIHLIGISSEFNTGKPFLVCEYRNQYYIGSDTGIFSLLFNLDKPYKSIEINQNLEAKHTTFPMVDIFVTVACHLYKGGELNVIGKPFKKINILNQLTPTISDDGRRLNGSIVYIDNYGNSVSNITQDLFETIKKGRRFQIVLPAKHMIYKIHKNYNQVLNEGKEVAVFNSSGLLEIAMYKGDKRGAGNASTLLGLQVNSTLIIEFL